MCAQAIETKYKGYRFRSRLEARWAVFLDSLGVRYRYEPEGFDLDGLWYLPDFYLPDQSPASWLEVKPEIPKTRKAWTELVTRAVGLCQYRKEHVLCLLGDPFPGEYKLFFVAYDPKTDQLVIPKPQPFASQQIVFAESDCGAVHLVHLDPDSGELVASIRIRPATRQCDDPDNCAMHICRAWWSA